MDESNAVTNWRSAATDSPNNADCLYLGVTFLPSKFAKQLGTCAGADEADPLSFELAHGPPLSGSRGPNIAVPRRMIVAPSSIATSKSPLIPMESSFRCDAPGASARVSRSLRSPAKAARLASGSAVAAGIAIMLMAFGPSAMFLYKRKLEEYKNRTAA